jgi:hypothetical protein
MRTRLAWPAALALLGALAFALPASAIPEDPKLFLTVKKFSFKPTKNGKPGSLVMKKGEVTGVLYHDGTVTAFNTPFETIIGAKVDFAANDPKRSNKIPQSLADPFSFLDAVVTIRNGKNVFIEGILTNITFDPGSDVTDGIVTLNLGFQLDNLWFTTLNTSANSRFIDEYASYSSMAAGALALTLVGSSDPKKRIDLFDRSAKGMGTGEFQIPEPGTLVLLLSGVAGLAATRRRP